MPKRTKTRHSNQDGVGQRTGTSGRHEPDAQALAKPEHSSNLAPSQPRPPTAAEAAMLDRMASGKSMLTLLPMVPLPEEYREFFMTDAMALRQQLIREHGDDPTTLMLVDSAVTAFFQTRQAAQLLNRVLTDGAGKIGTERAEKLDLMLDRAYRRMVSAFDALARPRNKRPVRMEIKNIEQVGNLCVGDQTVRTREG